MAATDAGGSIGIRQKKFGTAVSLYDATVPE
jgi:hypothetical protein